MSSVASVDRGTWSVNVKHIRARRRRQARIGWMFLAPFALLFTLVFLIPIVLSVKESFFAARTVGGGLYGGGGTVNTFVGFSNFSYVLSNGEFWDGMLRTIVFGLFQIPIMIGGALLLALLLDTLVVRRVGPFRLSYFLPYAIPGVVAAMVWLYLYTPELSPIVRGLQALGIPVDFFSPHVMLASMANITTWTFTGYNMLIFLAALQAIPAELYEAARIDGATGWQIVRRIKMPLLRSAALLAILLSIIGTVQLFNEPTIMRAGEGNGWMGLSYTPMMMAYNTMMGSLTPGGDGMASAISVVIALVAGGLAVLYAMSQRKVDF